MQGTFSVAQFGRFNSFTTLNRVENVSGIPSQLAHHKDPSMRSTEESEIPVEHQRFKTRSSKKLTEDLGISFEETFMDEHKQSLANEVQKYVEQQSALANPEELRGFSLFVGPHVLGITEEISHRRVFDSFGSLLTKDQADQLSVDFKREDKLFEFLCLCLSNISPEVGSQIMKIVNDVYEEYLSKQDHDLTKQEFLEFAENISQNQFEALDDSLRYLNCKVALENGLKYEIEYDSNRSIERRRNFEKFATFLITTIVLVTSGHFQNPYFKETSNYLKRESENILSGLHEDDRNMDSDEDEEAVDIFGSKKMKY